VGKTWKDVTSEEFDLDDTSVEIVATSLITYLSHTVGTANVSAALAWAYSTAAHICVMDGTTEGRSEKELIEASTGFVQALILPEQRRLDTIRGPLTKKFIPGANGAASPRTAGYIAAVLTYRNARSGLGTLVVMMAALALMNEYPAAVTAARNRILGSRLKKRKLRNRLPTLLAEHIPKLVYERIR
jgi:hypothetical protein